MEFTNIPGVRVYKDDGNLAILETIPGDVTLIIGTAPAGPFNQVYLVEDTGTAAVTFDPSGTKTGSLLKGMYEAYDAGAQYIALYRIGAKPAVVDFLNGWKIETTTADSTSAGLWEVDYQYNHTTDAHILRVYYAPTGELVYNSLTGLDTGAVNVSFDPTKQTVTGASITIGSINDGVALASLTGSTIDTVVVNGATSNAFFTANVAGEEDLFLPGMMFSVGTKKYIVSHVDGANIYPSHVSSNDTWGNWVAFTTVGSTITEQTATIVPAYYQAVTGVSLTYQEKFLELAKAYWLLESAQIDIVVPMDTYVDAPNVVNNLGAYQDPGVADFLGKVYQFEYNGEIFHLVDTDNDDIAEITPSPYQVGLNGVQATKLKAGEFLLATILSDVASPDADIVFHEANFAHQLATYLHGLSINDNEALGVMSMMPPQNYAKKTITNWLGKEPVYSADGSMIVSGTGLLGYKYTVGSTGVEPGFFQTITGFVDGTAVLDRNNMAVDIGKYLSIVGMPLTMRNGFISTSAGYTDNAAATYAGFIMSLDVRQSTTNQKMGIRLSLPFLLPKKNIDQLVAARYVVFGNASDGRVKTIDGMTASRPTSDYNRLATVRIVASVLEVTRRIAEPYIGKLFDGNRRNALESQMNKYLVDLQDLGYITGGTSSVRATRDMQIKGEATMKLDLVVIGELRKITIFLGLKK